MPLALGNVEASNITPQGLGTVDINCRALSVAKSIPIPPYLRLHSQDAPDVVQPEMSQTGSLGKLCAVFQQVTGWPLHYVPGPLVSDDVNVLWSAPVSSGVGETPGHLRIDLVTTEELVGFKPTLELKQASQLAESVAELSGELFLAREALWQREAELAASVPLITLPDEEKHLAARLESVLRCGAEAVNCNAAALYLLDAATTELKLRSSWGLPLSRLLDTPRSLADLVGDLEALSGHAVVLEDDTLFEPWSVPEKFGAAVCVPVSTPSIPLGTLWVFGNEARSFDDHDTNLIEVIAGRLAADLERHMLLSETVRTQSMRSQLDAASQLRQDQLPNTPLELDGWSVFGWTHLAHRMGGGFHDWRADDNRLVLTVGSTGHIGIDAAMCATMVQTGLRAFAPDVNSSRELLLKCNRLLWSSTAGDQFAEVGASIIDLSSGAVTVSTSGKQLAVLISKLGYRLLTTGELPLGIDPNEQYTSVSDSIKENQVLLLCGASILGNDETTSVQTTAEVLAQLTQPHLDLDARQISRLLEDKLMPVTGASVANDRSLIVLKQTIK